MRAAIHAYNPDMVVEVDGDTARSRFSSNNSHAFGDDLVETAVGYADCWYRRDDTSPTGWKAHHIVFQYHWGDRELRKLMVAGLIHDEG